MLLPRSSKQIGGEGFRNQPVTISQMKSRHLFCAVITVLFLTSANLHGQAGRRAAPPPKTVDQCIIHEPIHGNLSAQVAKFQFVSMPFSVSGLSQKERDMVNKLVD